MTTNVNLTEKAKVQFVRMPAKVNSEMARAIEGYFNGLLMYRKRQNCDSMKADCWKAMMAYYAMVDLYKGKRNGKA